MKAKWKIVAWPGAECAEPDPPPGRLRIVAVFRARACGLIIAGDRLAWKDERLVATRQPSDFEALESALNHMTFRVGVLQEDGRRP